MANKENKVTNKSALEVALGLVLASDHPDKALVAEKLQKQIDSLEKKSANSSGKLTKVQEANLVLADQIASYMELEVEYSISSLSKSCSAVKGENPQKIRPLLQILMDKGLVVRSLNKGRPVFVKVVED
jgi:hypothetical protein